MVKRHFWWEKMKSDTKVFVRFFQQCLSSVAGKVVPRPTAHTLHATKPNELLHFYFCYISERQNGITYILIMKDDISEYVWIVPSTDADAETTADALLNLVFSFDTVRNSVSDRGSHFGNELVNKLQEATIFEHHFTLAYCPWSNGTVEVVFVSYSARYVLYYRSSSDLRVFCKRLFHSYNRQKGQMESVL